MDIRYDQVDFDTIEIEDIDTRDYPDFSDANITYAEYHGGIPLDDDELDVLNEDSELVYHMVMKQLGYLA